jgi:hypothetical protein
MTFRRLLSVLCLSACAVLATGCGLSHDTVSFDPVARAASKTAATTSARIAFHANIDMEGVGGMAFDGTGVFDGRTKSAAMNMTFNVPQAAQAQLGGGKLTMQMILDGHKGFVMYMRSPMIKTLPADTWVKVDLQKVAGKAGFNLSSLMGGNQADPTQQLQMLTASKDAKVVNFDRVRGVLTTHYAFNVDLERLAKGNKDLQKAYDFVKKMTGVTSFPAEAWIDSQGHVRRIKVQMSMNGAQAPTGMNMTITEDLFDFGVNANIHAPTGRIVDATALTPSS